MPFGNDHADHIYVSDLGFVSGRDPLHFVERDLRRLSAAAGSCLILLAVLPSIILWPVDIFVSFNNAVFSALFGAGALTSVTELTREGKELIVQLLTWGIAYLLCKGMLQPPAPAASSSVGRKQAVLCALLMTGGFTALCIFGAAALKRVMHFCHLVELSPGGPMPAGPLALLLYLIRVILIPAVFEEAVFRRCLLQTARRHGDSFAIFFSALCGGVIHYTFTDDLTGFALGLVMGYFFLRTGSLKTVIGCHALTLAVPVLLELLQSQVIPRSYTAVWPLMMILLTVTGLAGFILFCRWNSNAFALDDSHERGLPFRRKLLISITGIPMLAAAALWLMQVIGSLQVIS